MAILSGKLRGANDFIDRTRKYKKVTHICTYMKKNSLEFKKMFTSHVSPAFLQELYLKIVEVGRNEEFSP